MSEVQASGLLRTDQASYGAVSVTTTATEIAAADRGRLSVTIQNVGSADVYLGFDSSVTTSNGLKLAAGASWEDERYIGAVYGIVASGSVEVRKQVVAT